MSTIAGELRETLDEQNIAGFVAILKHIFVHIPYQLFINKERFCHALLQTMLIVAGIKTKSEYSTLQGRVDLIVELTDVVYVIEIKFNESAQAALKQIEEPQYHQPFVGTNKKIILVGINFKRKDSSPFEITYITHELA